MLILSNYSILSNSHTKQLPVILSSVKLPEKTLLLFLQYTLEHEVVTLPVRQDCLLNGHQRVLHVVELFPAPLSTVC